MKITIQELDSFEDGRWGGREWNSVLLAGDSNAVFLTFEWQRSWWSAYQRKGLMLLRALSGDRVRAIAPFFSEEGMIYFVGSGGSDYLDFVGDVSEANILDALLSHARDRVPGFIGFQLFHIPDQSRTAGYLADAASRLGLILREEGHQAAPAADLGDPDYAAALTTRKSLLRHEAFFRRCGALSVTHAASAVEIAPFLDAFFQQHIDRWSGTGHPSLFLKDAEIRFYRTLVENASAAGWLRFTTVASMNRPIAFHFGFAYGGTFMWYKPSFAIDLARHSPGEVLLRQLFLRAIEERAATFDFGLGDEPFKSRFARHVRHVRNWGLYPAERPLPEAWA